MAKTPKELKRPLHCAVCRGRKRLVWGIVREEKNPQGIIVPVIKCKCGLRAIL